jgi:hypothetical protein
VSKNGTSLNVDNSDALGATDGNAQATTDLTAKFSSTGFTYCDSACLQTSFLSDVPAFVSIPTSTCSFPSVSLVAYGTLDFSILCTLLDSVSSALSLIMSAIAAILFLRTVMSA